MDGSRYFCEGVMRAFPLVPAAPAPKPGDIVLCRPMGSPEGAYRKCEFIAPTDDPRYCIARPLPEGGENMPSEASEAREMAADRQADRIAELEKQRDELLTACRLARGQLQSAADWARSEHREDGATRAFDACCTAIAKAEKKE